jgi:hypothetical protein
MGFMDMGFTSVGLAIIGFTTIPARHGAAAEPIPPSIDAPDQSSPASAA